MRNKEVIIKSDFAINVIAAFLALFSAYLIFTLNFNTKLFLMLNQSLAWIPPSVAMALTVIGDTHVALAILLPFLITNRNASLATILALIVGGLLIQLLKAYFNESRPVAILAEDMFRIIGPPLASNAFPSGHSATAFMAAAILYMLIENRQWRFLILISATLVALSRIIVGVHWPIDVLTGSAIGWLAGITAMQVSKHWLPPIRAGLHHFIIFLILTSNAYLLILFDSGYEQVRIVEQTVAIVSSIAFFFIVMKKKFKFNYIT